MSGTEYSGKLYVVRIKPTLKKNWDDDDIIYAIAYDGKADLSYNGFKNICEKNNQMWFTTKKANNNTDKKCSWEEVETTMTNYPATGSQKLLHTSSALTFLELATMAYESGIFTDPEGLTQITALNTKFKATSQRATSSGENLTGPYDDAPTNDREG